MIVSAPMRRIIFLAGISALFIACSSAAGPVASGPAPEIIERSTTQTTPLVGDPLVQVLCTIRNNGESGAITALASLDSSVGSFTERQTLSIASNEERQITFEFPEFEYQLFGNNGYEFSCGWELP